MSDRPAPAPGARDAGAVRPALDAELARMREELSSLQRELAAVRLALAADRGEQLREAKEQLVLATQRAEAIAIAAETLARRSRTTAGNNADAIGSAADDSERIDHARARALRDANEALLLAALGAQAHEEDAEAAHRKQLRYLAVVAHELRSPL